MLVKNKENYSPPPETLFSLGCLQGEIYLKFSLMRLKLVKEIFVIEIEQN